MTCKDCIHYDLCRSYSRIQLGWHGNSVHYVENIEEICKDFKDRSRFVELPIKPGEKVFYFDTEGRIYETTVTQLVYGASGFLIDSDVMFDSHLMGDRFFSTREEAERALKLKERENDA